MNFCVFSDIWATNKCSKLQCIFFHLWSIFWLSLNVRYFLSGNTFNDVTEDQPVGQLGLQVLDPVAAPEFVEIVVGPVRVDLDDRLRLFGSLRSHGDWGLAFGSQTAKWVLPRIHSALLRSSFVSTMQWSLNNGDHNALEKRERKKTIVRRFCWIKTFQRSTRIVFFFPASISQLLKHLSSILSHNVSIFM